MSVEITEKRLNWAAVGVMIVVAVNLFALVWGAAVISTGLNNAVEAIGELREVGKTLTSTLSGLSNRVGILEVRVDGLREEVKEQGSNRAKR